jgi:hypothetical protein
VDQLDVKATNRSVLSPKPRPLKYAEVFQAVEQRVVDALPEIIDGLIG